MVSDGRGGDCRECMWGEPPGFGRGLWLAVLEVKAGRSGWSVGVVSFATVGVGCCLARLWLGRGGVYGGYGSGAN